MRVLAVDYGDKRVGLAISDELGIAAHGLDTLTVVSPRKAAVAVANVAAEKSAERIVIGMPYNMDGTVGPRGMKTEEFCELVRRRTNLPVETFDERLSTYRAEDAMREAGLSERKQRGKKDQLAATIILQDYLSELPAREEREE